MNGVADLVATRQLVDPDVSLYCSLANGVGHDILSAPINFLNEWMARQEVRCLACLRICVQVSVSAVLESWHNIQTDFGGSMIWSVNFNFESGSGDTSTKTTDGT